MLNNKTILVIKKEWIETNNVQDTLELISFMNSDDTLRSRFMGQLELSFKEWGDEPLEHWNMLAIARWLKRLVSFFPMLHVFLDRTALDNRFALQLLNKGVNAFSSIKSKIHSGLKSPELHRYAAFSKIVQAA